MAARLLALEERTGGRVGRISVQGARVDVALDCVPGARVGDTVLVHAGVALAIVRDGAEPLESPTDDGRSADGQGAEGGRGREACAWRSRGR